MYKYCVNIVFVQNFFRVFLVSTSVYATGLVTTAVTSFGLAVMETEQTGTRRKLISVVEDVEIVSKELLEFLGMSRLSQTDDIDANELIALLKMKDEELQSILSKATLQAETQKWFENLKVEVEKRDADIRQLQRSLKESEGLLAMAVFQAKQKLNSVGKANSGKISSEELIKYAHKISASNAVAAPPAWNIGDAQRPYPTEIDMRSSLLAKFSDLPGSSQTAAGYADISRCHSAILGTHQSSVTWQPSAEVQSMTVMMSHCAASAGLESNKQHTAKDRSDDVEMMSSDSSSSSSSDE